MTGEVSEKLYARLISSLHGIRESKEAEKEWDTISGADIQAWIWGNMKFKVLEIMRVRKCVRVKVSIAHKGKDLAEWPSQVVEVGDVINLGEVKIGTEFTLT